MTSNSLPGNFESPGTVLLIIDMVSDFEFENGNKLFTRSKQIVSNVAALKNCLKAKGASVVYVNDSIGNGNSVLSEDVLSLRNRSSKAAEILSALEPEEGDHWIVKPQRSGFYATGLGNLLLSKNASSVIVTGVTTDICVLFTAHDAFMRGYSVAVPSNCCTAVEASHHEEAIRFLGRVAEANTHPFHADEETPVKSRHRPDNRPFLARPHQREIVAFT